MTASGPPSDDLSAAADYLQLATGERRVDVSLAIPVVVRVVDRARTGGHRSTQAAASFRARLLEHEEQRAELEVGSMLLDEELRGTPTVGRDHLALSDAEGRDSYLPLAWVSWVRRR